ncbi:MAG: hypothetical protein M1827_000130 [Pycnora praestabilis]|nr:MAG: hypothetical protein M1827_000130 [Pycnora praestabilis]
MEDLTTDQRSAPSFDHVSSTTRPHRPQRPNYNQIHALPLPLVTYPLPTFIPHNPLSIIQIVYKYVSQGLFPPSSHEAVQYKGLFSPETRSIHVTDPATVRAFWEKGFFGKGTLSRSEPSWLDKEKRRKGLGVGETSEEVTRRRREGRKEFKKERAKKEREAIDEQLREEGKAHTIRNGVGKENGNLAPSVSGNINGLPVQAILNNTGSDESLSSYASANALATSAVNGGSELHDGNKDSGSKSNSGKSVRFSPHIEKRAFLTNESRTSIDSSNLSLLPGMQEVKDMHNEEHLQLTLEEAFFLVYGVGVLAIFDQETGSVIPTSVLLPLFRQHSYFPPCSQNSLQPDDPFLVSYVVYHHFRSLGWVVRPGIKFGVDYVLYNRGPVFAHAEFAVIILPSYSHPYWSDGSTRQKETLNKERKSWWWLHCVNRVQAQVRKSLVLVYVEIPPPMEHYDAVTKDANGRDGIDFGMFLKQYKVREISLKRWIPNRSRD